LELFEATREKTVRNEGQGNKTTWFKCLSPHKRNDNDVVCGKTSKTKKKIVLLLSSQHTQPTVAASGKPEIIEFYNATKGGVDTFDQMCAVSSCSRKTRRWPLCIMYGVLNGACINSYVISCENREKGAWQKSADGRTYWSWGRRLATPTLSRQLHSLIASVCQVSSLGRVAGAPGASFADGRSNSPRQVRCCECLGKADRKARYRCSKCDKSKCLSHLYPMCCDCALCCWLKSLRVTFLPE